MTGSIKRSKSFILGVTGGSGSGKTYFAKALHRALGESACEIVYQDNFYIDQSHRFDFDGGSVNFDHPDSLDFKCLAECLRDLRSGHPTEIPLYDFKTHKRQAERLRVDPKPVIIVDGILIAHADELKGLFDDLIFFDTPEELRYQRRLHRDVHERGRTPEGVQNQFFSQVKPMHDEFVEPSKAFARKVVKDLGHFTELLGEYTARLGAKN